MKTRIGLAFVLALLSSNASATYYGLESCKFKYVTKLKANKYVGLYRSQYGNLLTAYFDSYCPASVNRE